MARTVIKLGVVGDSRDDIDLALGRALLLSAIDALCPTESAVDIVSGLTNIGIPRLAYEIAEQRGYAKTGISAQAALQVRCGICPVDTQIIVGEDFGDESEVFVGHIDALIRIGGGRQSLREVALFREACRRQGKDARMLLIEKDWPK